MEHSLPRKRKADDGVQDDHRCVPHTSPIQEHRCIPQEPTAAPAPVTIHAVDEASTRNTKRPRLEVTVVSESPPRCPRRRRSTPPRKRTPTPQVYPSHQYLLDRRASIPPTHGSLLSPLAESPIAPSPVTISPQLHIPQLLPTITRDTLRELDLEAILKNPQLRHDLLFDPGLQFRATTGRRKQLTTERYWVAVAREIEHGCTCAAWEPSGAMVSCGCESVPAPWPKAKRTRPPTPPPWSNRYYTAYLDAAADPRLDEHDTPPLQISVPSRIGPMLHELVAVLTCVIVPPPLPSAHAPPQAADAKTLLAHFDPQLIAQELRRGIFEPAGLFDLVGETLKRHCAPMRDRQVDAMVRVARGEEGTGTQRAVAAMRMCFEILELMKLDIANHQLQHLRPFLASSTPDFELRVFSERCRRGLSSPRVAREWLQSAWDQLKAGPALAPLPAPTLPLPRRTSVHLALIHAITHLVFSPPSPPASSGYPETLYLDTARVALLAADAADLTALYMLLMLWRQLVFWSPSSEIKGENEGESVFPRYARATPRLDDWEVDRVKREIWEVGPRRIGSCFFFSDADDMDEDAGEDRAKWAHAMQNVALQIAMRAEEARTCTAVGPPSPTSPSTVARAPPSQEALGLMRGWIASHMRRDAALAGRLRELLRREVAHAVAALTHTHVETESKTNTATNTVPGTAGAPCVPGTGGGTAGLEPLMPEIRHLAQRLAKLVLVNMQVYWSLYEAEGFLVEEQDQAC